MSATGNPSPLSDEALLAEIGRGESSALGSLYDRYGGLVYSLALHMLAEAATAEEITQDVFIQVWHKAPTYRPELGKVSTWLTSITRHRAIDTLRHSAARPEGHSVLLDDEIALTLFSEEPAVESQVEEGQQQRRLRTALAELPYDQKQALFLAYFRGYSHQQIAEESDQPLGTVKTRIRLGMQKLRAALGS